MNVEVVDGDSLLRKLDGLAHKHIIVALRPVEIEVSSLNWRGYRLSGLRERLGRRPLTPCKKNVAGVARTTYLEGEKVPRRPCWGPQ